MCADDLSYNAISCTVYKFEKDEIIWKSWFNPGTLVYPEVDMERDLMDQLIDEYKFANQNALTTNDQEMVFPSKAITKEGSSNNNYFVAANTNVDFSDLMEATLVYTQLVSEIEDPTYFNNVKAGSIEWTGKQYV